MENFKDSFSNFILENQQKELRAYDQKAGYYIASNSGLFVIALFTLCIFNLVHPNSNLKSFVAFPSFGWWALLIILILYIVLFLICNFCCFGVLFARGSKKTGSNIVNSLTNPLSVDLKNFNKEFSNTQNNFEEIMKKHIELNIIILRKKHRFANLIPIFSMLTGILLLALTILTFVL